MMSEMLLAYCGFNCAECPAYIATQTDDNILRANTAENWNNPNYTVTAEDINCEGCKTDEGRLFRFCTVCSV
ncbi:MAG: DUF3795 domain-containing protein [Candidatus Hodarchaeota archaeon]